MQIRERNLFASQRRVGSPCIYPCPMMTTSSLRSTSLMKGAHKPCAGGRALLEEVRPIEKFVSSVYSPTIPALHWELFRSRNLEGVKLHPTRATLMPHILRPDGDKSYTTPHSCLLPLEEMDGCLLGTSMSQSGISTNQHQLPPWN